jgi:pimeloyl-ACP methyl ester carboxylesterase
MALPMQREVDLHRITLLGFSLGGRVALSLYEQMHGAVGKLVLLAPDGLKLNFWYWLSTQTWLGDKIFYMTMKRPGWFFGMLKALNRFGLVNSSIYKFVRYYIHNAEVRRLLYLRWNSLRKLRPRISHIRALVNSGKSQVRLVYGKHDRIILPSRARRFCKGMESCCRLEIIESGHQVLHEKHVKDILSALML